MQPNGRVFKKLVCGEYSWLTYAEVDARARAFGRGLAALGQQVRENIVIFSETKAEWMMAAQGCFAQNFPSMFFTYFLLLNQEKFMLNHTKYGKRSCIQINSNQYIFRLAFTSIQKCVQAL